MWLHPIGNPSPSPSQVATHNLLTFQLASYALDHEDQGLRLKSQQPVMYDNLLAASAARRLSNT
jgi:hypothetical protein